MLKLHRILLLEYLRETFQTKEGDFLTFDALVLTDSVIVLIICIFFLDIIVYHIFSEASCSMCGSSYSFKGRLWHDDFC